MRFEELASRVPGVLALRTVLDADVVVEVHVLVGPGRDKEDVARSIRSVALLSDLDLALDRIHIVQLDADEEPIEPETPAVADGATAADEAPAATVDIDLVASDGPEAPADEPAPSTLRPRLVDVDVQVTGGAGRATVELEVGGAARRATVEFTPTTPTERRAVAEATLQALTTGVAWEGSVAVDLAVVIPMAALDVALVTLAAVAGDERTLVGAAAVLDGGVHEALARATLDATNRAVARRRTSS